MPINKVCTIQPDQWSTLIDVLKPLNTQGCINVVDSGIAQDINNGVAILIANIEALIGKDINFDIMNPNKHIKLFKLLDGDQDVDILDDEENSQFIATNGQIRVYLPKQEEFLSAEENKPSYEGLEKVGYNIKIDSKTKKEIETFIKSENVDSVDLLIKNEQLVGFEVKNTGVYLFPDYSSEVGINSDTADLVLKSFAFLIIGGDEFNIYLLKSPEDKYLLITDITTGYAVMSLNEELDIGGTGDELDLI